MINSMTQNSTNGVIVTGHSNGVVNMWTPNYASEPVVKMLTHPNAVSNIAVDPSGNYLVTAGVDCKLRIWDLRNTYNQVYEYFTPNIVSSMTISQKNLLAVGYNLPIVEIWKDYSKSKQQKPYIKHHFKDNRTHSYSMKFINFEDYLGIGTNMGYSQIIIPGSGEPNFDTFENNPFETKKQRRNNTVHKLLEKIPYTMINISAEERVNSIDTRSKAVIDKEIKEELKRKSEEIMRTQKKKMKKRLRHKENHDEILKDFDKKQKMRNKLRAMMEMNYDKKQKEKEIVKDQFKILGKIDEEFDPELYLKDDNEGSNDDYE